MEKSRGLLSCKGHNESSEEDLESYDFDDFDEDDASHFEFDQVTLQRGHIHRQPLGLQPTRATVAAGITSTFSASSTRDEAAEFTTHPKESFTQSALRRAKEEAEVTFATKSEGKSISSAVSVESKKAEETKEVCLRSFRLPENLSD